MASRHNRKLLRKKDNIPPPQNFGIAPELDLHALTVLEALPKLDEFLHSSFQRGYYRVRIIHGKGTGVLKMEVGRYLTDHPLVRSYRFADTWHGGSGVTEVDLSYR
ncbi:recombination inhibitory protein MutS2 [Dehalogenimonas sp. WBC-2]|nr:recombination inhibitory protein MutS2 [Dehalogenimonas sp. WBC-2]